MQKKNIDAEDARRILRILLKPTKKGRKTVHVIQRSVSRSGMTHRLSFLLLGKESAYNIGHLIYRAFGKKIYSIAPGNELKVSGCGMDMGFSVLYNLGGVLWPNGTKKPHGTRNGKPDTDGGYAINYRWL